MSDLFSSLEPVIDMTVSPTHPPQRSTSETESAPRVPLSRTAPSVITSPFVEPERPAAIAAVTAAPDRQSKTDRLLDKVRAAGRLGVSDADLVIQLGWTRSTVCSTRNAVRHQVWIARRVPGGEGVSVWAWRIATPDEQRRNEDHERRLTAAHKRWKPIIPARYGGRDVD